MEACVPLYTLRGDAANVETVFPEGPDRTVGIVVLALGVRAVWGLPVLVMRVHARVLYATHCL